MDTTAHFESAFVVFVPVWFTLDQFGSRRTSLGHLGSVWLTSDQFGSLRISLAHFGSVWLTSDQFGSLRINLAHFKSIWLTSDQFGSPWISLAHFESVWLTLDQYRIVPEDEVYAYTFGHTDASCTQTSSLILTHHNSYTAAVVVVVVVVVVFRKLYFIFYIRWYVTPILLNQHTPKIVYLLYFLKVLILASIKDYADSSFLNSFIHTIAHPAAYDTYAFK